MNLAIIVGNPRPRSRTWDAAHRVAIGLESSAVQAWDLADLGPRLLSARDDLVEEMCENIGSGDVLIVASPTYKATYTGLLKLFLDRVPSTTGLQGVCAIPLMLGGSSAHQLAAEVHLKPVLVELGAIVPTPALYLLDWAEQPDRAESEWIARWGPVIWRTAGENKVS